MKADYFGIQEISRQILSQQISLEEVSNILPCYVHINSLEDFSVLETDPRILELYDLSVEEINSQGFELLQKIVNRDDLETAIAKNLKYIQNQDDYTHVSFFQRLKNLRNDEVQMYYTRGKIIDNQRVLNLSVPIHNLEVFNETIFDLCEQSDFIRKNNEKFERLTKSEILICKELIEGDQLSTIAQKLEKSEHTIKNHRTNIYRKLEVKNYFEFYYLMKYFKF